MGECYLLIVDGGAEHEAFNCQVSYFSAHSYRQPYHPAGLVGSIESS